MWSGRGGCLSHSKIFQAYTRRSVVTGNASVRERNSTNEIKPFDAIPSPSALPVIGHMHHFFPGGQFYNHNILDMWRKMKENYGPIVLLKVISKDPAVFVFDPEAAATVLHGENQYPLRGTPEFFKYYRRRFDKQSVGDLLGEEWKKVRSMLNPILMQPRNVKIYADQMDKIAVEFVDTIKAIRDSNDKLPDNFDYYLNLWALESISLVGMGQRLNCLDPNLPEDSPVRKLVRINEQFFKILYKLDIRPSLWKHVATPTYFKGLRVMHELHRLAEYFVDKGIKDIEDGKMQFGNKKSMLEQMLELDKRMAYAMATDMMVGGVGTVSSSVMLLLYLLAVNPEKQTKLREQLKSGLENNKYLAACFKESFRMLSAAPGNVRKTTRPYNLLGYEVPENTFVFLCHLVMSTSEEHYHRATEFIPERWLVGPDDPLYYGNTHPFARNTAFGFGTRTCIGRRIAELEMEVLMKRIIERFQIKWDGPDPEFANDLLHHAIKRPYRFVFEDVG